MSGLDIRVVEGLRYKGKPIREIIFYESGRGRVAMGYICDFGYGWGYTNVPFTTVMSVLGGVEMCVQGEYIPLRECGCKVVYVEDLEVLLGKESCFRYYIVEDDKYEEYRVGCIDYDYTYEIGSFIDVVEVQGGVSGYRKAISYYMFSQAKIADLRSLGRGVFDLTTAEIRVLSYYIVDASIVDGKDRIKLGGAMYEVVKCCGLRVIGLHFTDCVVEELEDIISRYEDKRGCVRI